MRKFGYQANFITARVIVTSAETAPFWIMMTISKKKKDVILSRIKRTKPYQKNNNKIRSR